MIVAIIDIVSSRDVTAHNRRKLDKRLRNLLEQTHTCFKEHCMAIPALTQGDSIELLVSDWHPIIFLFHRLLMEDLKFRVGLGTGNTTLRKENTDECDGPAFWNARKALDDIKSTKYMNRRAGFEIDDKTPVKEVHAVVNSIFFLTALLDRSTTQLQYCFYYIWEKKNISEISQVVKTSKGNVSRTLGKTPCYLLRKLMTFLNVTTS